MLKRILDVVVAGGAVILLSPLFVLVSVALLLTGEHVVLYRQERIGQGGKKFQLLKFATMLANSPNMAGADITGANDPRVLPFGRLLRKTKINELPQLFNILRGDMSLIGYRPLTPRVAALFPKSYWDAISGLRPGLSGIGSIVFRDEERLLATGQDHQGLYRAHIVPHKMALELWYKKHQSFWIDFKLLVLTAFVVVFPRFRAEDWLPHLPAEPPGLAALRASSP